MKICVLTHPGFRGHEEPRSFQLGVLLSVVSLVIFAAVWWPRRGTARAPV